MAIQRVLSLLFIPCVLVFYFYKEKQNDYFRFNFDTKAEVSDPGYKYLNTTDSLGIDHRGNQYIPSKELINYIGMSPSIMFTAAGDLNGDGYPELLFTTANPYHPLVLYKNLQGEKFEHIEDSIGFGGTDKKVGIVYAVAFFDYNNDGLLDIYIAKEGCHDLLKNSGNFHFTSVGTETGVNRICNKRITGINLLDFDRDGNVDLYFTRLFGESSGSGTDDGLYFIPRINKADPGAGKNFLVQNNSQHNFSIVDNSGLDNGFLAWAAGVVDINEDGYPDIVVANDFSINRVYINQKNGKFIDQSYSAFGLQFNSGNMSVEGGDYDNDGHLDIFISNVSRSTYSPTSYNYLFKGLGGGKFANKSLDVKVDKCGWAWGSKFIDPNLDGKLDLFVINGFFNDGPKQYWYKWAVYGSLPQYLVDNPKVLPPTKGHQMESDQISCLFSQKHDGTFEDVSHLVGINDQLNGRGLAIADLKSNGSFDLIIANHNEKPIVYKQIATQQRNNWVGLKLKAKRQNLFAIGAKIKIRTKEFVRFYEHYPTNGFAAQSDQRVLVGIGLQDKVEIDVVWPDGLKSTHDQLKINAYNLIEEP